MSSRLSRPQSVGHRRLVQAVNTPTEPTACRRCGSVYFMALTARMYTSGGYELRAVGTTPMKVFVCPCGEILTPPGLNSGNQAGGERDRFAQSLATALAHRAEHGHELRARIADLQTQVEQLAGVGQAPRGVVATDDDDDPAAAIPGRGGHSAIR